MKVLRIFIMGMVISFLGTLPLGTLNISAMQISFTDGIRPAIYFALGALLVEMIYVRVSLVAMDWVMRFKKIFRILEWVAVGVILALAVSSFVAATDPHVEKNVLLSGGIHRFWLGVMMSAINPVQIPFWFGWSAVLFSRGVLQKKPSHYNLYIGGIGTGTFAGNLVFIYGGRFVVDNLNGNQDTIHLVIGGVFAVTAIIMAAKLIRNPSIDPGHRG